MKKTVKALVVAASVAAIVGIGAVSFAKWEGTKQATLTSGAATATITTTGFGSGTLTAPNKRLVPHDQPSTPNDSVNTTVETTRVWDIDLGIQGTMDGYTLSVTVVNSKALATGSKIRVMVDKTANATVTAATDISGWKTVFTGDGSETTGTKTTLVASTDWGSLTGSDGYTAHVVLESDSGSTDMANTISFTFDLAS